MATTLNDLFKAAFYQLIQAATISNKTNISILICECCGNPYECKRKNQNIVTIVHRKKHIKEGYRN